MTNGASVTAGRPPNLMKRKTTMNKLLLTALIALSCSNVQAVCELNDWQCTNDEVRRQQDREYDRIRAEEHQRQLEMKLEREQNNRDAIFDQMSRQPQSQESGVREAQNCLMYGDDC